MTYHEITIEQGTLRGSTATDYHGNQYLRFQGIPYAKPPIGPLRFKAPQPPEKWLGVWDATKERSSCLSRDMIDLHKIIGAEDCLFLNVYTKALTGTLRPVMFWVHGGAYFYGSGNTDLYGPDFLITEDVVVVTVNYPLEIWGFLRFEDPSLGVPGNAGLKDMIMALKWVQQNIRNFGGDPNNVTIFGESAGASSVHLLMLSSMAKGMFHKVIAQSGSAVHPWVLGRNPIREIAEAVNINLPDEGGIYKHLMKASAQEIFEIQDNIIQNYSYSAADRRPFGLVVEKNATEPAVLEKEPIDIIISKEFSQVPLLIGVNSNEGMFAGHFGASTLNFEKTLSWQLGYQVGHETSISISNRIRKFYYGDWQSSKSDISNLYELSGDSKITYPTYFLVLNHFSRSAAPTYLYKMTVETNLNIFKKLRGIQLPGVCHCDDLGYLFKGKLTPLIKRGSKEDVALTRFVKLWTNFARFGNPTPPGDSFLNVEWKPVTDNNLDYLEIGDRLVPQKNPDRHKIEFWSRIYAESPLGKKKLFTTK